MAFLTAMVEGARRRAFSVGEGLVLLLLLCRTATASANVVGFFVWSPGAVVERMAAFNDLRGRRAFEFDGSCDAATPAPSRSIDSTATRKQKKKAEFERTTTKKKKKRGNLRRFTPKKPKTKKRESPKRGLKGPQYAVAAPPNASVLYREFFVS